MMLSFFPRRLTTTQTRRFFFVAALTLTGGVSQSALAQQGALVQQSATTARDAAPLTSQNAPSLQRIAPAKNAASARSAAPAPRVLAPSISRADRELIEAAFAGETWKAREALSRGAKIEARDFGYNWTPLMWASLKGHVGTVRYLLSRGANANALGGGDRRMVMLNLGREYSQAAGNTTMPMRSGFFIANANTTALLLAASGGYGMTVQVLLDKGARIDIAAASGDTPLAGAAYSGNLAAVEALLSKGANIEARDTLGSTALVSAVLEGHTEVVKSLLSHGASTRATWQSISLQDLAKTRGYGDISRLLKAAPTRKADASTRIRAVAKNTPAARTGDDVRIAN